MKFFLHIFVLINIFLHICITIKENLNQYKNSVIRMEKKSIIREPTTSGRLIQTTITLGIEGILNIVPLKLTFEIIPVMIHFLKYGFFILFLLLLYDSFYIIFKGKSMYSQMKDFTAEELIDLAQQAAGKGKGKNQEREKIELTSHRQQSNVGESGERKEERTIGTVEMLSENEDGKELFQISDRAGSLTLAQIRENLQQSERNIQNRGSSENYLFQKEKWSHYYNEALRQKREKEIFFSGRESVVADLS